MSDYLTTRELAALLRIKERKVYDLAASGAVPCSKAMGKLLFPRRAVEAWLARESSGPEGRDGAARPNVILGSHDPLLEWALRESGAGIATYVGGSADGLGRFERGEGIAAGLHLYDPALDDWNRHLVAERCAGLPVVLIEWAKRRRGLILRPELAAETSSIKDLRDRRITPRQAESGAELLFRHFLREAGLTPDDLDLTPPARTETDAALMVLEGKADAAFGLQSLAAQYRLAFVPIIEERYDLLIHRHAWFEPPMQIFLDFCRSDRLPAKARDIEGYDISNLGRVHFNARPGVG